MIFHHGNFSRMIFSDAEVTKASVSLSSNNDSAFAMVVLFHYCTGTTTTESSITTTNIVTTSSISSLGEKSCPDAYPSQIA
ncbi:hypothetical protein RIR_jg28264.t1 [Rhizophagus irregularis DAOM 181602=DAOM 197198]|nr:hypothetical protein RIR_jg28264.t1 [Rhizophagus irregularis DAOM 181602=DAOM 197198]